MTPQPLTGPLTVSNSSSLTIPTVYACVQLISDSIGSLPFHSYRRGELVEPTPRLLEQPDPTATRIDTLSSIVTSLLLAGNAYCLLGDRDSLGYPQTAIPLNPDVVSVRTTQTGATEYRVNGVAVSFDDIMHIRGMTLPGATEGLGVVTATRRSLGIAIAGDEMAADFYTTGAVPTGVLQADSELTREEASDLKSAFVAAHGGRRFHDLPERPTGLDQLCSLLFTWLVFPCRTSIYATATTGAGGTPQHRRPHQRFT